MAITCPRDQTPLTLGQEHGIEVDRCSQCNGAWYEFEELAALESTVASEDQRTGTVEFATRSSDIACPVCGQPMRAFNYRAYNLELDACSGEHGFWLDEGESNRVREVMRERVNGLRRAGSAQKAWHRTKGGSGGGVIDQIKGLFRR